MERRGNIRNSKVVAEMIICDQEFRRAIQAIPVRELELPLWDTAKAEGRVLQQVKRPPRDRMELERYMRIADDFAESQRYELLDSTTLRCLAAGVIPWAWDQVAHGELLVPSNAIGIYFPQVEEVHTAISSASSRAVPAPIGRQLIQPGSPSNLEGGRMLRRASEQDHGEFVGKEAKEQRGIDLSAGNRYRGSSS
jgi:hypothetical protein